MKDIVQNLNKKTLTWLFDKDWADLLQIDQQNLSLDSFLNNILYVHASLKKS